MDYNKNVLMETERGRKIHFTENGFSSTHNIGNSVQCTAMRKLMNERMAKDEVGWYETKSCML